MDFRPDFLGSQDGFEVFFLSYSRKFTSDFRDFRDFTPDFEVFKPDFRYIWSVFTDYGDFIAGI